MMLATHVAVDKRKRVGDSGRGTHDGDTGAMQKGIFALPAFSGDLMASVRGHRPSPGPPELPYRHASDLKVPRNYSEAGDGVGAYAPVGALHEHGALRTSG